MENFNEKVAQHTITLVDFYATWCGPCRTMGPIIDRVKQVLRDRVSIIKYDIDDPQNERIVLEHNIRSVPTIVLYRAGKIVWRGSGVVSAEHLIDLIAKLEKVH